MKQILASILFCVLIFFCSFAYGQSDTEVIWKWMDGSGKTHFTDNFNSIPSAYRGTAIQGSFSPDNVPGNTSGGSATPTPVVKSRITNELEFFDEKYFEKDNNLVVAAKVRNGFANPISNVKIKVTFFDKDDNFIRSETTYIQPILLQPGQEGLFKIEIPFFPNISYYKRVPIME